MPAHRKRQGTHQDPRNARQLRAVSDGDEIPTPPAPRGLRKQSRDLWAKFWRSDAARYIDTNLDMHRLRSWIEDIDERARLREVYKKSPTVRGSTGQIVMNPVTKRISELDKQIHDAEAVFGMTPKARRDLGMGAGESGMSPSELNRMIKDAIDRTDEELDGDPELAEFEQA